MKRLPSLDGLRAISILLVLSGHLSGYFFAKNPLVPYIGDYANFGVRVFFVISGFLITTLLLSEIERDGSIDIKAFYVRRVFRIFPAFYAYIAVLAVVTMAGKIDLSRWDLTYASTYVINFVPHKSWEVGHVWSLSVEEQFYMLWPATMLFAGERRALRIALAVLALTPVVRLALFFLFPAYEPLMGEAFPTVSDSIATGCAFAFLRERLHENRHYMRVLRLPFWVVPVVALLVNGQPFYLLRWLAGETVMHLCIILIIDRALTMPEDLFGRFLNHAAMVKIGVLSYSLYLWQQPFFNHKSSAPWAQFPLNIFLAVGCAYASYRLIEKPALAYRRRIFARRRAAERAQQEPEMAQG